jgi:AraC family transcriptional regulator
MPTSSVAWPPAGIQVLRRVNPAGRLALPAIADHRISLHLSARTSTICLDSGERFVRLRGHVDLTPAQEQGGFGADSASNSLEVRMPGGFLQRVAEEMRVRRSGLATRHLLCEERLTQLLLALDAEDTAGMPGGRLYTDSLGVALAVQLLASHSAPAARPAAAVSARQLQRVTDHIEAHLDAPLSLERLADVAGVSRSYLQRAFRRQKGVPLHQYVVRRRVERARELLLGGTLPASEVALAVGFAHQSHMARWMRRLLGVTPRGL